jgi:RNA polymerase sigma factor (sigma-70 family)
MANVSKVLSKGLEGPIINVTDPSQHADLDILKSYFREILVIARNYARPSVDYEDLVAEGLMGLLDAIRRFDPDKATGPKAFRQLAIVRIKSYMFEFFLTNSTQYFIPTYMARAMALVNQLRTQITSVESSAHLDDILQNFKCLEFEESAPKEVSARISDLKRRFRNLADNTKRSYEEMMLVVLKIEDSIENYEQTEEFEVSPEQLAEGREFLHKLFGVLKPDAREVIASLLQGDTLREAGDKRGFTRERARQLKEETVNWLQDMRAYDE